MAVQLSKGGNINLSKAAPGLTEVTIGLGWDTRATDGAAFDLDASAFLLKTDGKTRTDADMIFYGQKASADGSVTHGGDNVTGDGAGDDEKIIVNLAKVPAEVERVAVSVTIYDADSRKQNFGAVNNAYIRVVNNADGSEIARFDLTEDASTETAMVFGEVYRDKSAAGEWKFKAVGQGYAGGLGALATQFGVNVG
ncbi:MAG: TerD family protein [Candidatus Obscuribacterales bacterium]|nr:TerD family protein [Candidatus Obscuribacterales bacterium]